LDKAQTIDAVGAFVDKEKPQGETEKEKDQTDDAGI
jgi:hypothetical protein